MALDTDTRKFSAVHLSSPWRGVGAIPSGALDEEEWFSVAYFYNEFAAGAADDPPILLAQIPNLAAGFDSGTHQYELGAYFSGATSYAIDPPVETGWTFNTTTGQLEIDTDDEATFGPYVITATNANGNTDSNSFTVKVSVSSLQYLPELAFTFRIGF
jgi:hypothetical protein